MSDVRSPIEFAREVGQLARLLVDRKTLIAYKRAHDLGFEMLQSSHPRDLRGGSLTDDGHLDPAGHWVTEKRKAALQTAIRAANDSIDRAHNDLLKARTAMERHSGLRVAKWDVAETRAAEDKARRRRRGRSHR